MKKLIDIANLVTYVVYANMYTTPERPLSRQRIIQLVEEGRLTPVIIGGKKFLDKKAKIGPSKAVLERKKRMEALK